MNILNLIKRFDDFEKEVSDKISKRENIKEKRGYVIHNKGAAQRYADNVSRELKRVKK